MRVSRCGDSKNDTSVRATGASCQHDGQNKLGSYGCQPVTHGQLAYAKAVAVNIHDDRGMTLDPPLSSQAQQLVSVVRASFQMPNSHSNPAVRDNQSCQCCYPITVADPEEMLPARNAAIVQILAEIIGWFFCGSLFCYLSSFFFAIPTASVVACCSKQRATYTCWGVAGVITIWLHVAAAIVAVIGGDECPAVVSGVQIVLCIVGLSAVYYGFKISRVLRESIHPMVAVEIDVRTVQAQYPAAMVSP